MLQKIMEIVVVFVDIGQQQTPSRFRVCGRQIVEIFDDGARSFFSCFHLLSFFFLFSFFSFFLSSEQTPKTEKKSKSSFSKNEVFLSGNSKFGFWASVDRGLGMAHFRATLAF